MAAEEKTFLIEDARIIFRNFAGEKSQYNAKGDRNFAVVINPADADQMVADGWNVKFLEPRDEDDEGTYYVSVKVSYSGGRPPQIVLVAGDEGEHRTLLTEDTVAMVDIADIKKVDLFCRGYEWGPINDKYGTKAYVKTMFITIDEDPLQRKYRETISQYSDDAGDDD